MPKNLNVLALSFLIVSCGGGSENEGVDRDEDVFVQNEETFAQGFKVIDLGTHRELIMMESDQNIEFARYYLLNEGQISPAGVDTNYVIHTPVNSVVCGSTGHASYFSVLGRTDVIKGSVYADRAMDPDVVTAISSGSILDVTGANEIDVEKVIELDPDLVIIYPSMSGVFDEIQQAGIKVMYFAEHSELHPLGRSEWIKVVGNVLNEKENAEIYFDELKNRYGQVKNEAMLSSSMPLVFFGSAWKGVWQAPGGRSASARLLRDAGARYLFEDNESIRGMQVDIEVLLDKGNNADFWGMVLAGDPTEFVNEMERSDPLMMTLNPVKNRHILYCDTEVSDYFGRAMLEPDVLLSDLVHIFHPGYLPEHDLVYFHMIDR